MAWPAGVGPPPDTVDRLCHTILDLVVDFADLVDWDLPDRRYVTPGQPAWDPCGQVSVHGEAHFGESGDLNQVTSEQNLAAGGFAIQAERIEITVVRCVTAWEELSRLDLGQVPDTSFDEADAALTTGDAQVILSAMLWGIAQDRLPADDAMKFDGGQTVVVDDQVGQVLALTFDLPTVAMFFVEHPDD